MISRWSLTIFCIASVEEIISLISDLSRRLGVTVISATHDHKMLATSDRILWIKDGSIDRLENRENLNIKVGSVN